MSYFDELKRRNVFKVGAAYVVTAWVLLQVASILLPTFHAPDWVLQAFTILLFLGFPVALLFAWAFELTPDGVRRERAGGEPTSEAPIPSRKLDYFIIAALSAALVLVVIDQYILEEQASSQTAVSPVEPLTGHDLSIAVLPFRNRSAIDDDAYFVDGIHDDILTQLSKLSFLEKVISRTSVEQYRDTSKTIPQIGQELGVSNILEGGVQRAGDRVRINVQLIEANADEQVWAETFDRELTAANIFSIQTDIAMAISEALESTLSPAEQQFMATVPTHSLPAYEAYQLGRQQQSRQSVVSVTASIELLEQATSIDPGFALAWVELAYSYMLLAEITGRDEAELDRKAELAVSRALEIDDTLSESQTILARLLQRKRNLAGATEAIERALALNANYAEAHFVKANLLWESGHRSDALQSYEAAVRLDPWSPVKNDALAFRLSEFGRFDEALALYRRIDEIDPAYPNAALGIGTIYGLSYGRLDLANQWYRKALSLDPANPWNAALLALVFIELNDDESAMEWINRSLQQSPHHPWANGAMMMLQSYLGNEELVRHYSERVLELDPRWRFGTALTHGRVPDVRAGKFEAALERFRQSFPEIFGTDIDVNSSNYRVAIDVAGLYLLMDQRDAADKLLAESQRIIDESIRVGIYGYWISDVQILALQDQRSAALAALRQAVDQDWVTDWRFFAHVDPNLDSIRNEPEFQAIMTEIETQMAVQLEHSRQMEADGELMPVPPP